MEIKAIEKLAKDLKMIIPEDNRDDYMQGQMDMLDLIVSGKLK